MANLVSPGVSVTVTDESFFIPAAAPTVPLIFVATAEEKLQVDGVTPAAGTYEHDVVRTVTSVTQSLELYGVPRFVEDFQGNQQHGDSRNEYGLFALNQFLGAGNLAYVVRANVNLNDDLDDIRVMWGNKMTSAAFVLENLVSSFIDEYNVANGLIPSDIGYKTTVTQAELKSLARTATEEVWDSYTFANLFDTFFDDNQDPLAATAGYHSVDFGGTINSGQQIVSFATPVNGATATGLTNDATVYSFDIAVDGGLPSTINVQGQNAQTYGALLIQLNAALSGASVSLNAAGNMVFVSDSTDITSAIAVTDTSLFAALTPVAVIGTATAGLTNPTGLANDATVYTATIVVDGVPNNISVVGNSAQTFAALISEVDIDLGGGANLTLTTGGDLVVTSVTTGASSTVLISVDGIFNALNGYVGLDTPVDGIPGDSPLDVYENGYDQAPTALYYGFDGMVNDCVAQLYCPTVAGEFDAEESKTVLLDAADLFQFTVPFKNDTSLGANDAARRVTIAAALQATINSNQDIRSETIEFNLILCPGWYETIDELKALSDNINQEALVIADIPMNLDPEDAVDWADNNSQRQRGENVAYYYPHGVASNVDGTNVFIAASGIALRTIAFSDNQAEVWWAPAGTRRGLVSGVTQVGYVTGTLGTATTFVEVALNQGQRDDLYKYFTNVNPITFFPGRGILVWGQKTSASAASARDRINVERLIMYVKRQLRKNAMPFVFQPNDQLTRDNLKSAADNFLGDIMAKRGLYDFATICDESNNTPDRIDRNELYLDIALKPTRAAEFIYIPIRIVATDAELF